METEIETDEDAHHSILGPIFCLYTLPVALLTVFAYLKKDSWSTFCLGLALAAFGTFVFTALLRQWRTPVVHIKTAAPVLQSVEPLPAAPPAPAIDLTPYETEIHDLHKQVDAYEQMLRDWTTQADGQQEHLHQLTEEKERAEKQTETLSHEFARFKEEMHEHQNEYRTSLLEHQNTIAEQREALDRKQQQIQQFETKIRDLNYEIKTLLQLAERADEELIKAPLQRALDLPVDFEAEEEEIHTWEAALSQLKQCVDVAQRIVGGSPFGSHSRFKELSLDNFTLDSRRLFDYLREIQNCTIFVYSPKENKMLFVNSHIRTLMGISEQDFLHSYESILAHDLNEWRIALSQLTFKNHTKLHLTLKNNEDQALSVQGLIGSIPTGTFRGSVIGILFLGT